MVITPLQLFPKLSVVVYQGVYIIHVFFFLVYTNLEF